ncbi:hypothetical protein CoNPh2_CDS0162 [Staphylococcus phage S-CoN_Ph2]|nr:hypothetical protein CoNPh2_CDS0162 [Staphylococcus phage S-CoN_Ph2]
MSKNPAGIYKFHDNLFLEKTGRYVKYLFLKKKMTIFIIEG